MAITKWRSKRYVEPPRKRWPIALLFAIVLLAAAQSPSTNNTGNGSSSGTLSGCGGNLSCTNGVVTDSQNPSYATVSISGILGVGGQLTESQACTSSTCTTPPFINAAGSSMTFESLATSADNYDFSFWHNGASNATNGIAAFYASNVIKANLDSNGDLTLNQNTSGTHGSLQLNGSGQNEIGSNGTGANDGLDLFENNATPPTGNELAFCVATTTTCGTPKWAFDSNGALLEADHIGQSATGKFAGHCSIISAATSCTFSIARAYGTAILLCVDETASNQLPCTASVSSTTVTISLLPYIQAGTCAQTSGACSAQTFGVAYSAAPICTVSDINATHASLSAAGVVAVSATTVTPGTAGSGSENVNWRCSGTPSPAVSHTLAAVLIGDPS